MKKTNQHRYETPKAEIIEIESQGILCASASQTATTPGGNGFQFGTQNGQW